VSSNNQDIVAVDKLETTSLTQEMIMGIHPRECATLDFPSIRGSVRR
jgi:hypothetical protein